MSRDSGFCCAIVVTASTMPTTATIVATVTCHVLMSLHLSRSSVFGLRYSVSRRRPALRRDRRQKTADRRRRFGCLFIEGIDRRVKREADAQGMPGQAP